jgi:hypothetical protein
MLELITRLSKNILYFYLSATQRRQIDPSNSIHQYSPYRHLHKVYVALFFQLKN